MHSSLFSVIYHLTSVINVLLILACCFDLDSVVFDTSVSNI